MRTEKVIGIDFGTTNSVVGVMDLFDASIMLATHGPQGKWTMPSALAYVPEDKKDVIGHAARARRGLAPTPTMSVKRTMGTAAQVDLGERTLTPPQAGAMVIRELVERMRATLAAAGQDFDIPRAVITVPAKYENAAQDDTRKAGELAGLEVVELLHEPVAAAIHFCWQRRKSSAQALAMDQGSEHLMIFDLGGGTFDVSIVEKLPAAEGFDFKTHGIAGNRHLGGDDFDRLLASDLLLRLRRTSGVTLRELDPKRDADDAVREARLIELAEQTKIQLSSAPRFAIERKEFFRDHAGKPVRVSLVYERGDLEALIRPRLTEAIELCRIGLRDKRLSIADIDTIVMVGGSSRIPLAQAMVKEAFLSGPVRARTNVLHLHAPEECIGAGAALRAACHGRIWRPDSGARLWFRGYATSTQTTRAVRVDVKDDGAAGEGATLTPTGRGAVAGTRLSGGIGVLFDPVELPARQDTRCVLALPDVTRRELAGFDFVLRHDPDYVAPLGMNTAANVLAFQLSLQVADANGQLVLKELAPRLTALPLRCVHTFAPSTRGDVMQLPVYGGRRQIRVVRWTVPDKLAPNVKVQLTIEIDGAQRVTCIGVIENNEPLRFTVESPEPEKPPTLQEYSALREKVKILVGRCDPASLAEIHMRYAELCHEIDGAFQRGDDVLVVERFHQLQELAGELEQRGPGLRPTPAQVAELVDECRAQCEQLDGEATTLKLDEVQQTIDINAATAKEAAESDPPVRRDYEKAVKNLHAIKDALSREQSRLFKRLPIGERARQAIAYGRQLQERVDEQTLDPKQQETVEEAARLLGQAEQELTDEAAHAFDHACGGIRALSSIQAEQQPKPAQAGQLQRTGEIDIQELLRTMDDPRWNPQ